MEPYDLPLVRALRGERVQGAEMMIVPERGPRRVVRVSAQAIRDAGGDVRGAVAALHDITGHKQAVDDLASLNADLERRVQERTAEAERANEAKSEFLSRMSHELRTPLNAMLGFAQLLGMDELRSDQAQSVEHIMSGGRHLLALINDVLDLARIESGSLAVSIEPTPLGAVLQGALDLVRPQAASVAVSLPTHAPPGANVHVLADHQRLHQIVVNLLSNAVKYNSEAGTVSLNCEGRDHGQLRLAVTDTGPGIAAEDAQRIFMPFERLEAGDTAVEGTGLGLAKPDIPGGEVLQRLMADVTTAAIPVVVVSADATDAQLRRLLAAGAAAYLTKPLDVGLFFATVEEALQANREQRRCDLTRRALEPASTAAAALPTESAERSAIS